jgi:hypothetical protein
VLPKRRRKKGGRKREKKEKKKEEYKENRAAFSRYVRARANRADLATILRIAECEIRLESTSGEEIPLRFVARRVGPLLSHCACFT